jgi:C4-dicarboxylate transporter, DctQ subunit
MATSIPDGLSPGAHKLAVFDLFYFKIESFFNFIAGMAIFTIMLLGVVQVVGRSVFNFPVRGYVDIVEISITVFAFLGLAYCQRLNGHVRMEIIIGRFKGRLFWGTEIFGTVIAIVVVSILMVYGWDHFMRAWSIGDSTMDIEIPLWPSKLLVPFAFAMLILRLVIQLVGFIRLFLTPSHAHQIAIPKIETVDEIAQAEIDAGLAGEEEKVDIINRDSA